MSQHALKAAIPVQHIAQTAVKLYLKAKPFLRQVTLIQIGQIGVKAKTKKRDIEYAPSVAIKKFRQLLYGFRAENTLLLIS